MHAQGLVELGGLARLVDAHYVERYFRALDPNPETVQDSTPNTKLRKSSGIMSLAAVTAMYTGHTLSKGPVRTSNWEAIPLDGTQLECMSTSLLSHPELIWILSGVLYLFQTHRTTHIAR